MFLRTWADQAKLEVWWAVLAMTDGGHIPMIDVVGPKILDISQTLVEYF